MCCNAVNPRERNAAISGTMVWQIFHLFHKASLVSDSRVFSTECPKTAAEAPHEGSVLRLLVVAMTTEVATAAGAMMIGVTGTARAMTTEETTIVPATMRGGITTALAMMTGGTTGPRTMIALDYRPLTLQVYFPSKLTTSAMKLALTNFVLFSQNLGK